ncbi:MAG: permease [Thermoanaerobaculia bacterium]
MDQVIEALLTSAGLLWKILWALVLGYTISAGIQVLVTRAQMARTLGEHSPKKAALASFFGFVSSSCSFAALAASRSVLVKGAHPVNAIAFLIASTNLVIELGIVLLILLGWHFFIGNILLGLLMTVYAYAITRVWFPSDLADAARQHAEQQQSAEGMEHEGPEGKSWREKLTSLAGWQAIADAFFMEWKMAYKEILFGFTIAGFITVFVPQSFWNALFLQAGSDAPSFLAVLENAAIAPVIAFFTFIGSMGNIPLAALLWSKNASFGGVMAFLGADLVAATVIYLHAKYYGWRYAGYLSLVLYVCMVAAGVTVHYVFAVLGILPTERALLTEMVRFKIDYTFWLNLVFTIGGGVLLTLHFRGRKEEARTSPSTVSGRRTRV